MNSKFSFVFSRKNLKDMATLVRVQVRCLDILCVCDIKSKGKTVSL